MDLKTEVKKFCASKSVRLLLALIIILALLLITFQAGVLVGLHRAEFSRNLGDNYYRMFGDRHLGGPRPLGYGVTGKVLSVGTSTLVVAAPDNTERIVRLAPGTFVRRLGEGATTTDIRVNDSVIVIGTPDPSGEITAKLIRLLPYEPNE